MNILTIAFTILIVIIVLAFLLYKHLLDLNAVLVNLFFPIFTIVALLSLFVPVVFTRATEFLLDSSAFSVQLKSIDKGFNDVSTVPNDIFNGIKNFFNPSSNETKAEFKSELYPNFINFVAEVIRWMVFIFSVMMMLVLVYFKYSTASILRIRELEKKYNELAKSVKSNNDIASKPTLG